MSGVSLWGPGGLPRPASGLRRCHRTHRIAPATFPAQPQVPRTTVGMGEPEEVVPGESRPRSWWRRAGREGPRAGGRAARSRLRAAPSEKGPRRRRPDCGARAAPPRKPETSGKEGWGAGSTGKGVLVLASLSFKISFR